MRSAEDGIGGEEAGMDSWEFHANARVCEVGKIEDRFKSLSNTAKPSLSSSDPR